MSRAEAPDRPRAHWDRRAGEGPTAFRAFTAYRDMGPERSIRRVVKDLGIRWSQASRWASRFAWVRRAAAWDDHLDRLRQREQERKVRGL